MLFPYTEKNTNAFVITLSIEIAVYVLMGGFLIYMTVVFLVR